MSRTTEKGIAWRKSAARAVLLRDLENGTLPISENYMVSEEAWKIYQTMDEFVNVPFSQFKRQLKAHRQQVHLRKERVAEEETALVEFRQMNPRKRYNNKHEPVFDMTSGKQLLRQDIKDDRHTTMTLGDLQKSRPEYACLTQLKFKDRVHQEIRRQKYFHFLKLKSVKGGATMERLKETEHE